MQVITNIETLRIDLVAGQRVYYIPYLSRRRGAYRIGVSPTAVSLDGATAYPVGGTITYYDDNLKDNVTISADAYITLVTTTGLVHAQDFNLALCRTQAYTQSPLDVCRVIDYDNSYIRIPSSVPDVAIAGKSIFLNFYYYSEQETYQTECKRLVVEFPRNAAAELRLSDYIVGYQGELLRIECSTPNTGLTPPEIYVAEPGYITLCDATGRAFNTVPLDNFYQQNHSPYLGANAPYPRIYNPLRLQPMAPVWQNCKIFTGSAAQPLVLTFIFA